MRERSKMSNKNKKNKKVANWKHKVAKKFDGRYQDIGRATASSYGVAWSTMWDFKQVLIKNEEKVLTSGPKILFFDIETAPILANIWSIWQQNVGLSMIDQDWHLMSYAAGWMDGLSPETVIYEDVRNNEDITNDYTLVLNLRNLLDEADIVVGQNSKKFDHKKLNARCLHWDILPPSPYKIVDTLNIAKRGFSFTSNKLEYMTDKFCKTYKKLPHGKFAGYLLWQQCLAGNPEAWNEMEEYNRYDVLSLWELYTTVRPWIVDHPNVALYYNDHKVRCNVCGSDHVKALEGKYSYTNLSKFALYECQDCGKHLRDANNTLDKEKRQSLLRNVI